MNKYKLVAFTRGGKRMEFACSSMKEAAKLALNKGIVSPSGKIFKGFFQALIIKEGEDIESFSFNWSGVLSPYQYDWSLCIS